MNVCASDAAKRRPLQHGDRSGRLWRDSLALLPQKDSCSTCVSRL